MLNYSSSVCIDNATKLWSESRMQLFRTVGAADGGGVVLNSPVSVSQMDEV
jgi:hypothetical protein